MKQKLLLFGFLTFLGLSTFAKQIDENLAKQVGQNFLSTRTNSQSLKGVTNFQLIYQVTSKVNNSSTSNHQIALFYVFNAGNKGFVIVSGDDNVTPILGYSDEGVFDPSNIPQSVQKWFEEYKNQILNTIDNNISATQEIQEKWTEYMSGSTSVVGKATQGVNPLSVQSVNPLIQTKWSQSPYENALCPYDINAGSGNGYHAVTGCPATAMAQIMKYWNYPATGSGFHSYNHSTYGTLSANFGSTTYQWGSMPNIISSSNNAIATLMYHCGVAVEMGYGPTSSGSYVINAGAPSVQQTCENAFKTYFGYNATTIQGLKRSNYSDANWINLLKNELDQSRPIQYAGYGSGGGHTFVCDGYDNNSYFHMNWGWGGSYDGYFQISALNPSGLGTGGGSGGYNSNQQALIGIEPPSGSQTYNMALYNYVTPSQSTIYYGQAFNVTSNIVNNGTNTYNGDYAVAVFDASYNFIDYVQTLSGQTLQGGYAYTSNLTFSTTGLLSMLPGTYYAGVFYRPTGGNWILVANNGSYSNLVQMTVINPNDIELNSAMVVTPSTTLTQGQSASVNLNIINDGTPTFIGQYGVNLYNLDGTFAQSIGTINENNGLPSGYTYLSPYLTFTTPSITVTPGTYLLAVSHNPNGSGWQLTGSSYYQNPIKVTVVAPSLQPDVYEVNNAIGQSYNLPITFSGSSATKNTVGSNCHITTDNDYYKIVLPTGYNYTVTPRIHDSYNSGNGNVYTLDGLFSYSTDGTTWSNAFDDVMTGNIIINGGGTVYFHIAPYFAGETGTYLLDMTLTRSSTVGINENQIADNFKIYPNPAKDFVIVDFNEFEGKLNQVRLINIQGQNVFTSNIIDEVKTFNVPLTDLSEGIYFIQLQTDSGILAKKIIVSK